MILRVFLALLALLTFLNFNTSAQEQNTQESNQQINDFSLAGFGERGKKTWDLSAKSADIFQDKVRLKDIIGNLYTEQDNIKLTGDKGVFNKTDGRVHLEQNVVITTSSGAKLTTDSLDWDRKNQTVLTEDLVNIEKDYMVAKGKGARGHTDLNKVTLDKYVRVDINSAETKEQTATDKDKIVITCYGPLEIDFNKNVAVFKNNVKVDTKDAQIYSDRMEVYFIASSQDNTEKVNKEPGLMGNKIDKIIARDNVKIIRGENISYSEEATYLASDKKVVLTGSPRLIIYSAGGNLNASSGN
jgi:LPS export ABC transporter protein LptC